MSRFLGRTVLGRWLLTLILPWLTGCWPPPAKAPVQAVHYHRADTPSCLIVALPGLGDRVDRFARAGFVNALAEANIAADFTAVNAHFGYYAAGNVVERVYQDILLPAKKRGYRKLWVIGTSMGGAGAMGVAMQHPDLLAGVLLLAPYMGDMEIWKPVAEAGGLKQWTPSYSVTSEPKTKEEFFRAIWLWLKRHTDKGAAAQPPLYLGYGRSDDLARPNGLLRDALPLGRTETLAGGHGWSVWQPLWQDFMESGVLQLSCGTRDAPL